MYIFAANGITIGEITHNEKKETVVRAFRHALVDALPNDDRSYSNVILHDLTNIVNIPQDCPNYAERLNFAIYHIQSVYALANALGRSEANLQQCRDNYFKATSNVSKWRERAYTAELQLEQVISG